MFQVMHSTSLIIRNQTVLFACSAIKTFETFLAKLNYQFLQLLGFGLFFLQQNLKRRDCPTLNEKIIQFLLH